LLAAAFAPMGVAPLAVLCPAFLFLLWEGAAPRAAAWRGFLFTGGTFLAGTYWLYNSIHLVGQAPLWIALFLMLGLVAIMGSYTALLGYAVARWGVPSGPLRWLVLLPAGWVVVEWFRGWFLSGFPWLALGYSQLETPLRGYAPVSGVYGTSFAAALMAGAIVALLLVMAILLALVGGLGLMGTMSINVLERTREIGVLRAIGAPNRGVAQVFIREGIAIGLLSWMLGAALAIPMSRALNQASGEAMMGMPLSYSYSMQGLWGWLVAVILLSALASYVPARNATRLTVREVLAYE